MKTPYREANVQALVAALFSRCPSLVGFSIQDTSELTLGEVELQPWNPEPHAVLGEVAGALLTLVDEEPEALALLRGRTFARTLH